MAGWRRQEEEEAAAAAAAAVAAAAEAAARKAAEDEEVRACSLRAVPTRMRMFQVGGCFLEVGIYDTSKHALASTLMRQTY